MIAVLSLESSGESLHKRGYRAILTKAPLNEALAAALILMTGWRGDAPLIDPMCGSGTLCIEAAWIALRRPPGLTRRRFGFMGWMNFDVGLWTAITRRGTPPNAGRRWTIRSSALTSARDSLYFSQHNARAAGIGHLAHFEIKDLRDFRPPDGPPGVLLCNPPYGERIGEEKELKSLYKEMGNVFKDVCQGWKCFVFTGNAFLARQIGLQPVRQIHLFNGKIPCRLLEYQP